MGGQRDAPDERAVLTSRTPSMQDELYFPVAYMKFALKTKQASLA